MSSLRQFLIAKGYHRIKLNFTPTQHFMLTAEINDIEGTFLLDTGASSSCVGEGSAEKFELLSEASDVKAAGAGRTGMQTKLSTKNKLKIGDWEKRKRDFMLFDMSHINTALSEFDSPKADGFIGADILKKGKAVIDYKQKCLYLK
jgi:predicted aspartyl protease